jgi:hypothetical protein
MERGSHRRADNHFDELQRDADMAVQGEVAAALVAYVVPPCAVLHVQYVVGVTVTLAARKS